MGGKQSFGLASICAGSERLTRLVRRASLTTLRHLANSHSRGTSEPPQLWSSYCGLKQAMSYCDEDAVFLSLMPACSPA